MKVRCEYCRRFISDTDASCPYCGAVNERLMRSAEGVPKTVAELKAFCERHKMPLQKMRFFIDEDYQAPRAFGIYTAANGDFVVYKNKANGERAVRYRGKDEAYAVNEIYQKLKSEVQLRRGEASRSGSSGRKSSPGCLIAVAGVVLALAVALFPIIRALKRIPSSGYYNYNGTVYYNDYTNWYAYDDAIGWEPATAEDELTDNYSDYWQSYSYSSDIDAEDFSESEYYSVTDSDDWDSDSWDDDDWDYDYDSWDSGGTDWGSDW